MDIQDMSTELQKFVDAQGINMDIQKVLSVMDAGDFVELSQAMDDSDNHSIMQTLQKYRARTNENFSYFNGTKLSEAEEIQFYNNMGFDELVENYRSFVKGATYDHSHLSLSEMKTLVKEDLTTTLGGAIANNDNKNQATMNPQVQAKVKQAELQKNTGNPNFNVTVPDGGSGNSIEQVLGVDVGSSPEQSLVVTKDPSQQNQVQVFGLNDVEPVQEDSMDVQDGCNEHGELVDPELQLEPEMQMNPEIIRISSDEMDGSIPENEISDDEIIAQIMDFCSKLQGLN